MSPVVDKDAYATKEEKTGSTVKTSESSSTENQSGPSRATPAPGAGIPGNPFDFSNMANLLNDPSVRELAKRIASDPSFTQMAAQLEKTLTGPEVGDAIPQFDAQQYYSSMQEVVENPLFVSMTKRFGSVLTKDPSMSQLIESLANSAQKDQLEELIARLKEDPSLNTILEEIETGGPAVMMRYWNDRVVLKKLGEAMGVTVLAEAATSSEDSGLDESDEEGNEDESIVHNTASVGDVEVLSERAHTELE